MAAQKPYYVMAKLNKTKYKQAILYFANRIPAEQLGKVKLFKLLYFLDFDHYHRHGKPVTGETYRKLDLGPAPTHFDEIVVELEADRRVLRDEMKLPDGYRPQQILRPLASYDLTAFSAKERETLEQTVAEYGGLSGKVLSALSHDDPPWVLAEPSAVLDYEDTWYRYNPELDEGPDPIADALAEVNLAQLIEDRFGKGDEVEVGWRDGN